MPGKKCWGLDAIQVLIMSTMKDNVSRIDMKYESVR